MPETPQSSMDSSSDEEGSSPSGDSQPEIVNKIREGIQDRLPIFIPAALTTLVVFRVAAVSGFSVSVALAIVNASGSAQVLMGAAITLLPLAYSAAAWLGGPFLARSLRCDVKDATDWLFAILATGIFLILVAALVPWWGFIIALGFFTVPMFIRRKNPPKPLDRFFYLGLVAMLVKLLMLNDVWLPAEVMDIAGRGHVLGYLLKDDGQWATVLEDDPREILLVHSSDLRSRQVCSLSGLSPSLVQLLHSNGSQPECDAILRQPEPPASQPTTSPMP